MGTRIFQVDSFCRQAFAGNPAAVCLPEPEADALWMQNVAAEMNLSETAFVLPRNDGDFDLRWFTPTTEVDLCGHATLASALVLWSDGVVPTGEEIRFHSRSGVLTASTDGEEIFLDFPADTLVEIEPDRLLQQAFGKTIQFAAKGRDDILIRFATQKDIEQFQPDFVLLATIPTRGFIITAEADSEEVDFVSRFFGPAAGIDEDPVTGSAHCTLATYWHQQTGNTRFRAQQLSARGGELSVEIIGERVRLGGRGVMVFKGELYV